MKSIIYSLWFLLIQSSALSALLADAQNEDFDIPVNSWAFDEKGAIKSLAEVLEVKGSKGNLGILDVDFIEIQAAFDGAVKKFQVSEAGREQILKIFKLRDRIVKNRQLISSAREKAAKAGYLKGIVENDSYPFNLSDFDRGNIQIDLLFFDIGIAPWVFVYLTFALPLPALPNQAANHNFNVLFGAQSDQIIPKELRRQKVSRYVFQLRLKPGPFKTYSLRTAESESMMAFAKEAEVAQTEKREQIFKDALSRLSNLVGPDAFEHFFNISFQNAPSNARVKGWTEEQKLALLSKRIDQLGPVARDQSDKADVGFYELIPGRNMNLIFENLIQEKFQAFGMAVSSDFAPQLAKGATAESILRAIEIMRQSIPNNQRLTLGGTNSGRATPLMQSTNAAVTNLIKIAD